ncbi:HK97 family phage prohead protease [Desulfitobacterium hafniense]|uniref:HK97 family phage prohead protease n=1 Tax=Desulfitobacterium hafniense TaxID=49338 RepID=UPI00059B98FF|nr:HK97 family phage prohead protease [Desulfitobacterium hafniense]
MSKKKNLQLSRDSSISLKAMDKETRQVELSFSSEEPYDRWFGPEILSHQANACELARLNEIGCLLFNHTRDKVVGRIDKAWIENGRGKALVTFDEDEESEIIYQKVLSGTLKGVSVSYRVDSWEEVGPGKVSSDGRFTGPCSIALKWMPLEVSIVSVPADATVGVGREMEEIKPETRSSPLSLYYRQLQFNKNFIGGI